MDSSSVGRGAPGINALTNTLEGDTVVRVEDQNQLGVARVVRVEGCTVRDGVDIDNSGKWYG